MLRIRQVNSEVFYDDQPVFRLSTADVRELKNKAGQIVLCTNRQI